MRKPADMLTYRHPRTALEAFGCNADSANPLQHYPGHRSLQQTALTLALVVTVLWSIGYLMSH